MLPIPSDFFVENSQPGQFYQHCLPQVFRYLNTVSHIDDEIFAAFNGSRRQTTDRWETIHIQSMTADFGDEKTFLRNAGFSALISAEEIAKYNGGLEFPSVFGYWDEGTLSAERN
jgi:hypothetical protein